MNVHTTALLSRGVIMALCALSPSFWASACEVDESNVSPERAEPVTLPRSPVGPGLRIAMVMPLVYYGQHQYRTRVLTDAPGAAYSGSGRTHGAAGGLAIEITPPGAFRRITVGSLAGVSGLNIPYGTAVIPGNVPTPFPTVDLNKALRQARSISKLIVSPYVQHDVHIFGRNMPRLRLGYQYWRQGTTHLYGTFAAQEGSHTRGNFDITHSYSSHLIRIVSDFLDSEDKKNGGVIQIGALVGTNRTVAIVFGLGAFRRVRHPATDN